MATVFAEPLAYSPVDAARVIGISRARLYELLAQGVIPARKLGHRTLILRADLERYVAELPEWTTPDPTETPPKGIAVRITQRVRQDRVAAVTVADLDGWPALAAWLGAAP